MQLNRSIMGDSLRRATDTFTAVDVLVDLILTESNRFCCPTATHRYV